MPTDIVFDTEYFTITQAVAVGFNHLPYVLGVFAYTLLVFMCFISALYKHKSAFAVVVITSAMLASQVYTYVNSYEQYYSCEYTLLSNLRGTTETISTVRKSGSANRCVPVGRELIKFNHEGKVVYMRSFDVLK